MYNTLSKDSKDENYKDLDLFISTLFIVVRQAVTMISKESRKHYFQKQLV